MSNYSFISKILHRQILNNKEILNLFLEKINKKACLNDKDQNQNIFITGLARAGTTALLQSLDSTNIFGSLRYKYMPFILSPKLASTFSKFSNRNSSKKIERIHKDGILIGSNSPECLDEVYWINTASNKFIVSSELKPSKISKDELKGFSYLINKYLEIENKSRFLIKNNNSHLRIIELSRFFHDSFFLVMFREPISHANSLLKLHKNLLEIHKKDKFVLEYMNLIGHWEFGENKKPFIYKEYQRDILFNLNAETIEYWLYQWIFTYEWILDIFKKNRIHLKNIKLVCYEELCKDSNYKKDLFKSINIPENIDNFKFEIGKSDDFSQNLSKMLIDKSKYIYKNLKDISVNF